MWSLWTMEPSQSPPSCSTWGGIAEASTATESVRRKSAAARRCRKNEQGEKTKGVGGACESLLLSPPPTYSLKRPKRPDVGGRRGINCAHSPHVSRLLRISASRNCRTERAGGFGIRRIRAWAGARTWRAPSLRRRLVTRVGWQAFRPRGTPRLEAGPRPGAQVRGFPPPDSRRIRLKAARLHQGRLLAAGLSR